MKIHEVKIYQEFDAPAEMVFETFSDHAKLGKIMGLPMERIVDSPTPGNPNGVGSVRLIKAGPFSFEETIQKAEKPSLLEYKITRGTPLNHRVLTLHGPHHQTVYWELRQLVRIRYLFKR